MRRSKKPYNIFQLASAIFMIMALLWLTISAPFVFGSQQKMAKENKVVNTLTPDTNSEEETANPFGNATEEKTSGNTTSFSEEYLHEDHTADYFFFIEQQYHNCENAGTYIAFHGELHVPPPNAA